MQSLTLFGHQMQRIEGTARLLLRSASSRSIPVTFCSRISGMGYCHVPPTATLLSQRCLSSSGAAQQHAPLRNEQIKYPSMRVVFKDPVTGSSAWKIMDRKDALDFAKSQSLDLILVNNLSDPPVCKLDNFGDILKKDREKEKEKKIHQKARVLKEMFVGAGIDPHDLGIKMNKVKEFLADGHPVKVVVTAKKGQIKLNPMCVDETTMNILVAIEHHVSNVQQPESSSPSRKDFTLNPKSQKS